MLGLDVLLILLHHMWLIEVYLWPILKAPLWVFVHTYEKRNHTASHHFIIELRHNGLLGHGTGIRLKKLQQVVKRNLEKSDKRQIQLKLS